MSNTLVVTWFKIGVLCRTHDPLDDGMDYVWLSWKGIERSGMERLLGQKFDNSDFIPIPDFARRATKLSPDHTFPQTWGVMF